MSIKENIKKNIIAAWKKIKSLYNQNISPRIFRLLLAISYAKDFIVKWALKPIYNRILSPIQNAITAIFTAIWNYIVNPIITGIAHAFKWLKDNVANPFVNFLQESLRKIYDIVIASASFQRTYALLQLEYIFPTGDKIDHKQRQITDPKAKRSAELAYTIAGKIFFALALGSMPILIVGASTYHFITLACLGLISFAIGISFTATVLHNEENNPDQSITAIIFASIIMLSLIYVNLTLGGVLLKIASAIISFGAFCFVLAHQQNIKDYNFGSDKPMASDFIYFVKRFDTAVFMANTSFFQNKDKYSPPGYAANPADSLATGDDPLHAAGASTQGTQGYQGALGAGEDNHHGNVVRL
tara:strand:- start:136 stop:1206 length:1071 start_codon:yes stop_codon:yes gene_type:complete